MAVANTKDLLDNLIDSIQSHNQLCKPAAAATTTVPLLVVPSEKAVVAGTIDSEKRGLRHCLLIQLLQHQPGMNFHGMPLRALDKLLESRAPHLFPLSNRPGAHVCRGRVFTPSKRRDEADKLHGPASMHPQSQQGHLSSGCDFERFQPRHVYWDPKDEKRYAASGNLYICTRSGLVHHCTDEHCHHQEMAPHGESMICSLTHKNYGQPLVKFEPKEDEAREGSAATLCAKGTSFYQYRGGNSAVHEYTNNHHDGRGEAGPRRRAMHSTRKKALMQEENYRAQSELVMDGSGGGGGLRNGCVRSSPQNSRMSHFSATMQALYPGDRPTEPSNIQREQLVHVFKQLLYDRNMRKRNLEDLQDAEQLAEVACEKLYRDSALARRPRDPFEVMATFQTRIKPFHARLCSLGVLDETPNQLILEYYFEVVLMMCRILHYTVHAKRLNGLFKRHSIGMLYVLQSGVTWQVRYNPATGTLEPGTARSIPTQEIEMPVVVHATEFCTSSSMRRPTMEQLCSWSRSPPTCPVDPVYPEVATVCFVPRHAFLDRLPSKTELNQYSEFGSIGSAVVNETLHFVQSCFHSIFESKHITQLSQLAAYRLESYVHIRHYEKNTQ
jgi:hypothetical protein